MNNNIKILAFDADDTLWENESLYRETERFWAQMFRQYGTLEELSAELYAVEEQNMEELGYGAKAFIISLVECSIKITGGKVTADEIGRVIKLGRTLHFNSSTPYEGVVETLSKLQESARYKMLVITKGDLLDQEKKLQRSGLMRFFDHIEIVSNKTELEYSKIIKSLGVQPEEFLMVGNSFKSDIAPVLNLGANAIYIPSQTIWEHERMTEYEHSNLVKVRKITELDGILL